MPRWGLGDDMWNLLNCSVWRDGGSLSATVQFGPRILSFWLQVADWDRPEDLHYGALFVSEGSDPTLQSERVSVGAGERHWLGVLQTEVDGGLADESSRELFTEFLINLRARCG